MGNGAVGSLPLANSVQHFSSMFSQDAAAFLAVHSYFIGQNQRNTIHLVVCCFFSPQLSHQVYKPTILRSPDLLFTGKVYRTT